MKIRGRHLLLATVLGLVCALSLAACGGTKSAGGKESTEMSEQSGEKGNGKPAADGSLNGSDSDKSKENDEKGEDFGIGYISCELDKEYFSPVTNDYLLTANTVDDGYGNVSRQYNSLYSFDESGKCVQARYRIWENGKVPSEDMYMELQEVFEGEGPDQFNPMTFGAKMHIYENTLRSGVKMYLSKELTQGQTETKTSDASEEVMLSSLTEVLGWEFAGDDYLVELSEKTEVPEFVQENVVERDGMGNPTKTQWIRTHRTYSYSDVTVTIFDEKGNKTKGILFKLFDQAEDIQEFYRDNSLLEDVGLKFICEGIYDLKISPDFDVTQLGWKEHNNLLYQVLGNDEDVRVKKWEIELSGGNEENNSIWYLSKEYLTNIQISAMLDVYGKK